jgi:hypothetical protein
MYEALASIPSTCSKTKHKKQKEGRLRRNMGQIETEQTLTSPDTVTNTLYSSGLSIPNQKAEIVRVDKNKAQGPAVHYL